MPNLLNGGREASSRKYFCQKSLIYRAKRVIKGTEMRIKLAPHAHGAKIRIHCVRIENKFDSRSYTPAWRFSLGDNCVAERIVPARPFEILLSVPDKRRRVRKHIRMPYAR